MSKFTFLPDADFNEANRETYEKLKRVADFTCANGNPKPLICRMAAVMADLVKSAGIYSEHGKEVEALCALAAASVIYEECDAWVKERRAEEEGRRTKQ